MRPPSVSTQLFGSQQVGPRHLEMMRAAGFQLVEVFAAPGHFDWDAPAAVERLARDLKIAGLGVSSLHAPWAPGQDIAALDPVQRERSLAAVERAVDALLAMPAADKPGPADKPGLSEKPGLSAAGLSLQPGLSEPASPRPVLVLHPGEKPAGPAHKEEQMCLAEEGIERVAAYCAARHVRVALENPPPYELAGDNADLLRLYRRLSGNPAIAACFDTGHAYLSPEGMSFAGLVPQDLLLVHLSDNLGRSDDHLLPGQGVIPWQELFSALRERRFAGHLVLELTDLPDPATLLAAGRAWIDRAMEALTA